MEVFELAQLKCEPLSSFADKFCIDLSKNLDNIWIIHQDELKEEKIRDSGRKCQKLWSDVNLKTPQFSAKSKPFMPAPIIKEIIDCIKRKVLLEYLFNSCFLLMKYENSSFETFDDGKELNTLLMAKQRIVNKKRKHLTENNFNTPAKKPKIVKNKDSPDLFENDENRLTRTGKKFKRKKRKTEGEAKLQDDPCSPALNSEPYLDMILYCFKENEKILQIDSVDDLMLHIINQTLPISKQIIMLDEWFYASSRWLQLRLILHQFINNEAALSKNHGYKNVLKKHLKCSKNASTEEKNCHPVLKSTVVSYICDVLRRTIPKNMFGNANRKRKIFFSSIAYIIHGKKNQSFSLNPFLRCFEHSIEWKTEMAPLFQLYMPVKITNFFLIDYVLKILKSFFYVTECGPTGYELFYYVKSDVSKVMVKQRDLWLETGKLKAILMPESDALKLPFAKIRLLPKSPNFDDCRAITIIPKTIEAKQKYKPKGLRTMANILDCMISCYGTGIKPLSSNPLLKEAWQRVLNLKETSGFPVYFVKADIVDAFGSVNHERLMRVLENFCPKSCKEWPEICIREWCCSKGKLSVIRRNSFSRKLYLNRVLHSRELSFIKDATTTQFKKDIKKMVCEQYLKVGRKIFLLSCGLSQGGAGPLSNRLCDLYYSAMDITFFYPLLKGKNALLLRGTDDYLFVSTDRAKACQFHSIVQQGIPRYNARFNPKKMETNIYEEKLCVTYLGLDFNFQCFDIEPNFDRYNSSYLNFIKLNVTSTESYPRRLKFLKQRSFQIHVLKLIPIVCNTQSNDSTKVIKKISNFFAKRTLELSLYLKPTTSDIISILRRTANRFCHYFNLNSIEVKKIYWAEVNDVFKKNNGNFKQIVYKLNLIVSSSNNRIH